MVIAQWEEALQIVQAQEAGYGDLPRVGVRACIAAIQRKLAALRLAAQTPVADPEEAP
jgi:hypothetical protein